MVEEGEGRCRERGREEEGVSRERGRMGGQGESRLLSDFLIFLIVLKHGTP